MKVGRLPTGEVVCAPGSAMSGKHAVIEGFTGGAPPVAP